MFKGFQNNRRSNGFNGFPALNFQMNNEAYGFSGCTFWLDAAYGLNTQTDLAAVSSWQSKIGGVTFTQATAGNQPRLIASDITYNNYPSIEFNGTSRRVTSPYLISIGLTTAIVANYSTINTINTVVGSTANTYSIFMGGSAAGYNGCGLADGSNIFTGTTENTDPKIFILTDSLIVVDSISEGGSAPTWATSFQFDQIGMRQTNASASLNGKVAEILMFPYKMNLSDCQRLSANINSKYALY